MSNRISLYFFGFGWLFLFMGIFSISQSVSNWLTSIGSTNKNQWKPTNFPVSLLYLVRKWDVQIFKADLRLIILYEDRLCGVTLTHSYVTRQTTWELYLCHWFHILVIFGSHGANRLKKVDICKICLS